MVNKAMRPMHGDVIGRSSDVKPSDKAKAARWQTGGLCMNDLGKAVSDRTVIASSW